jgi:hypothetical protein
MEIKLDLRPAISFSASRSPLFHLARRSGRRDVQPAAKGRDMKRIVAALAAIVLVASPAFAQGGLPNLVAVRTIGSDGKPTLAGWRSVAVPKAATGLRYSARLEPSSAAFSGARVFVVSLGEADAVSAARKAAAAEGFETTKVLAEKTAPQAVVDRLEKGSKVTAVMLEGRLGGRPARFVGHVWYGAAGEPDGKAASGVHAFVAPEPVFVALGGFAIPAVLFLNAKATPDSIMAEEGSLAPEDATAKLASMFAQWASANSGKGDNLSTLNGIMQGNLGVQSGTGCINTPGCVGGGTAPVYTKPPY